MPNYEKELQVVKDIAYKAGPIMRQYFFGDQQVSIKSDNSVVTIADTMINDMVIKELGQHFTDGIIGEEQSTAEYGLGRRWFCDPIDGTKAFVWGTPTAMFSLGLVEDGEPVVGVAYDPFLDRIYTAVKDGGAFCNNEPIHVSRVALENSHFTVTSDLENILNKEKFLHQLIAKKARLATFSGAVYKACLVACGKFSGYVEDRTNAHDLAAVALIVAEAGGKVSSLDGNRIDFSKPFKGGLLTNGVVHDEILECLSSS